MAFLKSEKKLIVLLMVIMFSCSTKDKHADKDKHAENIKQTKMVNKLSEHISTVNETNTLNADTFIDLQQQNSFVENTRTESENDSGAEYETYSESLYDSIKPEIRIGYLLNQDSTMYFYNKPVSNRIYYVISPTGELWFNFSKLNKRTYEACVDGLITTWVTKIDYSIFVNSYYYKTISFDWKDKFIVNPTINSLIVIGTEDSVPPKPPLHFAISDSINAVCLNTFGLDSTGIGVYSGGSNNSDKRILVLSLLGDGFFGIVDLNENGMVIRLRKTINQTLYDVQEKWNYSCQADLNNDGLSDIFLIYSDYDKYLDYYTLFEYKGNGTVMIIIDFRGAVDNKSYFHHYFTQSF